MLQYSVDHRGRPEQGVQQQKEFAVLNACCHSSFHLNSFKWRRLATQSGQNTTITENFLQKHSVHSYPETS